MITVKQRQQLKQPKPTLSLSNIQWHESMDVMNKLLLEWLEMLGRSNAGTSDVDIALHQPKSLSPRKPPAHN